MYVIKQRGKFYKKDVTVGDKEVDLFTTRRDLAAEFSTAAEALKAGKNILGKFQLKSVKGKTND